MELILCVLTAFSFILRVRSESCSGQSVNGIAVICVGDWYVL